MNLSDSRKRRPLALAATLQLSLGLLDLVGIATIGLVAAVALSGAGIAENILDALGLSQLTVFQISVIRIALQ